MTILPLRSSLSKLRRFKIAATKWSVLNVSFSVGLVSFGIVLDGVLFFEGLVGNTLKEHPRVCKLL